MKLYILTPKKDSGLWEPWYDKAFGFIVRATSPAEARKLAAKYAGDEGENAWLNAANSFCKELTAEGIAEVVLRDFSAA